MRALLRAVSRLRFLLNSFIVRSSDDSTIRPESPGKELMSGVDAVKKIVETEAQGRGFLEEATSTARDIISGAAQEIEKTRQEILARARARREEVLQSARASAETEAASSETETGQQLASYEKAFENRKTAAVEKAVGLILGG